MFRRRDPLWEVDGPTARNARRRRRLMAGLALVVALVAFAGAAFAWSIELGIAAGLGIHARLPFG